MPRVRSTCSTWAGGRSRSWRRTFGACWPCPIPESKTNAEERLVTEETQEAGETSSPKARNESPVRADPSSASAARGRRMAAEGSRYIVRRERGAEVSCLAPGHGPSGPAGLCPGTGSSRGTAIYPLLLRLRGSGAQGGRGLPRRQRRRRRKHHLRAACFHLNALPGCGAGSVHVAGARCEPCRGAEQDRGEVFSGRTGDRRSTGA